MFETLTAKVNTIDASVDYWFVRTDSGQFFDTYLENNFIGIGWNYVTLEEIRRASPEDIKAKILKREKLDSKEPRDRGRATSIYRKLERFVLLKKDDRIIMPSANSDAYAFGVITDNRVYTDTDQEYDCPYYKRRKVRWISVANWRDLDPIYYKIRMSRHAISNVRDYAEHIDKQMDSLFYKEDASHFVINVKTRNDINLKSLTILVNQIEKLYHNINVEFQLNEDVEQSFIKLNLQSPGKIELIVKTKKTLIILAALLAMESSSTKHLDLPSNEKQKLEEFRSVHKPDLDEIDSVLQSLEVDKEKISNSLADGAN